MLLPSKDFGLMSYNFGQCLPQGQVLPAFPDLFHRGKTKYRKTKLLFVHFPSQDWKQSVLPRGTTLWVSWKKTPYQTH